MKVWHKPEGSPVATRIPGPGDLAQKKGGTLLISGEGPDGGAWIVALGYAVARGASVIRS